MKKEELRKKMPGLVDDMGIEGIRDELAEYFETAGAGGRDRLAGLSDEAIQALYVKTFADEADEPAGWYEQWHRDYTGR